MAVKVVGEGVHGPRTKDNPEGLVALGTVLTDLSPVDEERLVRAGKAERVSSGQVAAPASSVPKPLTAENIIAVINAATTPEEVNSAIPEAESRKTVLAARDARLKALADAGEGEAGKEEE